MSKPKITKTEFAGGFWRGLVEAKKTPKICVTHQGRALDDVSLAKSDMPNQWTLRIPVPVWAVGDGVQTFLIEDMTTGEVLESFAIAAGEVLRDDFRAEIGLLRAELDVLKTVIRRNFRKK